MASVRSSDEGRLSTGIDPLDRELNGGLFPGSIVVVSAPPRGQSDPLLYATMRERETLYVTTRRSERAVRDSLDRAFGDEGNYTLASASLDSPLRDVAADVDAHEDAEAVVVDTVNPLERRCDEDEYLSFLNDLKSAMLARDGVALLHCADSGNTPRLRNLTESLADVVWDFTIDVSGMQVENRLVVTKFRGDELPDEAIKLELGQRVSVDTSRDIA